MTAARKAKTSSQSETAPQAPGLISSITLRNLLSFGPETPPLDLHRLNVLVGPNGSGKSNLLDLLGLLRSMSRESRTSILQGASASDWIWKGSPSAKGEITAEVNLPGRPTTVRHKVRVAVEEHRLALVDEQISDLSRKSDEPAYVYVYVGSLPMISRAGGPMEAFEGSVSRERSILAQLRDPVALPEITGLADTYPQIRLFRDWTFGRNAPLRLPQKTDLRNDRLEEDFSNLGLILNRLRRRPQAKAAILAGLQDLYDGLDDFDVSVEGNTVQVFFTEGDLVVPATRLSDGSLRYLCLLAILLDPDPPPFIAIEEPELGLHPDLIHRVADLLVEASARTQLLVTTHSDILIDALTEHPDSVVVFEKQDGQTSMTRLDAENVKPWLEDYRLGELWLKGQLGGTRW